MPSMKRLLPPLDVSREDGDMLQQLAQTLVARNLDQCNAMPMTHDGLVSDTDRWRELRKADGVRIYEERATATDELVTPSLLLLGHVAGTVEDIMYAAMATTDVAMLLQSSYLEDGVVESKVLHPIVHPTPDEPFRHVSVKWRRFDTRDYVCVDATGLMKTPIGENVGFCVSHSISFRAQLPVFDRQSIDRGNRSVCALYRQRSRGSVECYVRGFFDFDTTDDVVTHSVALQNVALHWLSIPRLPEFAFMKKIVWHARRRGVLVNTLGATDMQLHKASASHCELCNKSFGLLGSPKVCKLCSLAVCSRCCQKKLVGGSQTSMTFRKRTFCTPCMLDVGLSDATDLARKEAIEWQRHHCKD